MQQTKYYTSQIFKYIYMINNKKNEYREEMDLQDGTI